MAIHSIYINFGFYPDNIRFERAKMKEYFGNDDLFKLVTGKLYNSKNKKGESSLRINKNDRARLRAI